MKKQFFVYTKDGLYKTFNHYYYLLCFVRVGRWRKFGHTFLDKRRVTIDIRDTWHFNGNTFLMGPAKSINVKYIAKDAKGNILNCKRLEDDAYFAEKFRPDYPTIKHYDWRTEHKNYLGFRNGPVPYTGGWGKYRYFRAIKTTQERKLNIRDKEFTRGKRRNLPDSWDDIFRNDRRNKRSWKKQKKKKQWM